MRAVGLPRLERLAGAAHPVVYQRRASPAPAATSIPASSRTTSSTGRRSGSGGVEFLNLMTARLEPVEAELGDLAARRIGAGEWPWSFFCYPEERPRPVFPSSFRLLAPDAADTRLGARRALPGLRPASRSTSSRTSTSTSRSTTTT